jgi:hypothetical protein
MRFPERPTSLIAVTIVIAFAVAARAEAAPRSPGEPDQAPGPVTPFEPPDPARTRLNFLPTARMLARGDITVRLVGAPPPLVQVGITDRLSFGAAAFLTGAMLTPKVQVFRGASTQAAVGAYHFAGRFGSGGLAYAVTTHGDEDGAFTVGAGWSYAGFLDTRGGTLVILAGGERRITPRGKVIAEAMILHGMVITSVGVRHIRARAAIDFGVLAMFSVDQIAALPMLNVSWRF